MGDIRAIPRSAPREMLPGLKLKALVQTKHPDYSQEKGGFATQPIPAGAVGRVRRIFDFGSRLKSHRFLIYAKFAGHPETNFYAEELIKVRV